MAVGTTNYPTSLDTVVELVEAANNAADQLSGNISDSATSLTLMNGSEFAQSGIVAIDNELLSYTSRTGNTLNGLVRGIEGTTAAAHTDMSAVRQVITAASHNVQSAAIIALENKLGTGTDIAWSKMAPLTTNRMLVSDAGGDVAVSPLTHDATNAVIGNIGGLDFDTTPTATPTTARMVWDDTHGTVNLTLKGGTVGVDIGQTTVARVVNKTVTSINLLRSNYQVVRIVSAQGQRLAISLAQGNSEPNSTDVIGLVAEDIANNQEGFIVARGLITEINTTGSLQGETWADGDILYLSPTTAGGLTKVEPQAPNHLVIVGYVVYAHSQHGKIYVAIQTSWETKELHDVKITGTPVAGSLLIRNATTGVWENATLTAGSNITITNADKSITINSTASGSGDVVGPSSATDNALARFDTTTGKLIQNSLITLSDAGALSFPDGVRQTFNPNGTNAGINVGAHTSDPSSPTNGDLWYNSTANQLKTRRGATTEVVATIPSNLGDEIPVLNATTGNLSATGEVFWDGSGNALQIGNASTGALRLANATGTDSFTLLPPASGGAVALTLPPGIGSNGQALTSDGTGGTSWTTITAGVSSVSGTSPVVSSGGSTPAISLASGYGDTQNPYASKTANSFLAAPNGTAGAPTFRAIVAADIPTLNQNTTGTASNVTGTVAIANGGTGQTTQQAALNTLAGAATSGQYLRGNGTNVVMSAIQAGDVPTLNQNTTGTAANVTGVVAIANGGTGQTTRQDAMDALAGAVTAGQYLRGNGTDVVMSAIQVADVPTLNQNTTGTASNVTGTVAIANGGTGATTAGAARTNLGATTVGGNLFTLTNPGAVTFPRFNADNTVSALTDTAFRTAIGAGTVTGVTASSPLSSSGGATPNLSLGTVPVANGGTGVTTVSSGQLLIGTSAGGFAASTLTAGTGIAITNGSGTISIATTGGSGGGSNSTAGGRLTLTSGTPVTTNDVTAATTLYYTPYVGNSIALFDGTSTWAQVTFTERSIAIPSTTNTNYDVFVFNNAGTATLELTAWTNDTTRATALTLQDGIYVRSGATTRRYVGTIRTTSVSGQCEDSAKSRLVWNFYNQIARPFLVRTTGNYTYTTATWRAAGNVTTLGLARCDFVLGLPTRLQLTNFQSVWNKATIYMACGIGLDRTNANDAIVFGGATVGDPAYGVQPMIAAFFNTYVSAGYHYAQRVEISSVPNMSPPIDETYWFQSVTSGGVLYNQSGMHGDVLG